MGLTNWSEIDAADAELGQRSYQRAGWLLDAQHCRRAIVVCAAPECVRPTNQDEAGAGIDSSTTPVGPGRQSPTSGRCGEATARQPPATRRAASALNKPGRRSAVEDGVTAAPAAATERPPGSARPRRCARFHHDAERHVQLPSANTCRAPMARASKVGSTEPSIEFDRHARIIRYRCRDCSQCCGRARPASAAVHRARPKSAGGHHPGPGLPSVNVPSGPRLTAPRFTTLTTANFATRPCTS